MFTSNKLKNKTDSDAYIANIDNEFNHKLNQLRDNMNHKENESDTPSGFIQRLRMNADKLRKELIIPIVPDDKEMEN